MEARYRNVSYTGADAVRPFIDACSLKYPDASFVYATAPDTVPGEYDYVVASGVFNVLYTPDVTAHRDIVFRALECLFDKTRVQLSIDFMTDAVDFRQPGGYHQNPEEICRFVRNRLSRRLVLDQSYLPYEYAVTIWKNQGIRRPDNVYDDR